METISLIILGICWTVIVAQWSYDLGKKRGSTTINNYHAKHANINVMEGSDAKIFTTSRIRLPNGEAVS